jgi:hypothetical protein
MGNFYLKDSNEKEIISVNILPANFKNIGIKNDDIFYEYCPGELNLLWHTYSYKIDESLLGKNLINYADFFVFKKNLATLDNNPLSNLKKISDNELLDIIFGRKISIRNSSSGNYLCNYEENNFFILNEEEFNAIK